MAPQLIGNWVLETDVSDDAATAISAIQFKNFHWLVIYDPGDETEFEGLDWQTWFVYYDYEDGEARIVGLSPATWSP